MNRANVIAVAVIAALLVVGGVAAIVVTTTGDDTTGTTAAPKSTASAADTKRAAARDAALADGREAVKTVNTLGYQTVEEDLDRWESVATGELLDEVRRSRQTYVDGLGSAKSTTVATVLDAALTDLDEKAGTARLMAALSIEITIEGQEPVNKRTRVSADLERTADGWKLRRINTL